MRTIATLQTPTAGSIRFGDIDVLAEPEQLRRTLGYLPQDFGVYPRVSAYDDARPHGGAEGRHRRAASARRRSRRCSSRPTSGRAQQGARRLLRRHAPALRHRPGADRQPRADHRRRAHRRPRPRGAQPLPQPAGRDRRERRGDPLDPHRRRRRRPLPAHGGARRRPGPARGRAGRADRDDPRAGSG